MNDVYKNRQILKIVFVVIAIAIMIVSTIFTNQLVKKLAVEETKKIEIWAEATKQLIVSDSQSNISFLLQIIEGNTTIPVVMTDDAHNILSYRNIKPPNDNIDAFVEKRLTKMISRKEPIVVKISSDSTQYIYYDESSLLKQLQVFPFVQIAIVGVFFIIIILVFSSTKRAEQNRVWVGLSKETAHQLGTPISSMLAWAELLKLKYPTDELIADMEKDVSRLGVIADRFSKIGSKPNLKSIRINEVLENSIQYIRGRSSDKVQIINHTPNDFPINAHLNTPLFEWVLENLFKNAIDAMDGSGKIEVFSKQREKQLIIDVKDTGKGMERKMYKTVFSPGFTTKQRGWGLGLSLAKRIIEEYHEGKIFVKDSEVGVGTTFRIILPIQINK